MKFENERAIYLQIANYLCEKILRKKLKEEERIPSAREFSKDISVNPNTIIRSYKYLENRGIIHKKRGLGYFVVKHAGKKVLALKKERFFNEELPAIFKSLNLLGINFGLLEKMYGKSKKGDES